MKTAKKKTAKAVKKGSPASRGPKAGGAPLRLEVGKCYGSSCGVGIAEIIAKSREPNDPWPMEGEWLVLPRGAGNFCDASWSESGRWGLGQDWDLVREVPRPKPPKGAK